MKTVGPIIACTSLALLAGLLIGAAPIAAGDNPPQASTPSTSAVHHKSAGAKSAAQSAQAKSDQAIGLVWRTAEVKKWLSQFPRGKSKLGGHPAATADIDTDGGKADVYSVHVYEDLSDHTATFNWYEVDLKSKKVTKLF